MWCVVHVRDGEEEDTEDFIAGLLSGSLNSRCFHLMRSRRKKFEGRWHTIQEDLFPGYVFIDTDQPDKVFRELKKAPKPKLLFSDETYVSVLEPQESDLMDKLADGNGVIGISVVNVAGNGMVRYLSGPLTKVKSQVQKVNLHKRVAQLETSLLGKKRILYLGIELETLGG